MRLSFDLPNKNTSQRIYSIVRARFRHNQKRYQFKTEISVPIALWIQKEQRLSESRDAIAKAGLSLKQIRAYNEHLQAVRDKFTETIRKQRLADETQLTVLALQVYQVDLKDIYHNLQRLVS